MRLLRVAVYNDYLVEYTLYFECVRAWVNEQYVEFGAWPRQDIIIIMHKDATQKGYVIMFRENERWHEYLCVGNKGWKNWIDETIIANNWDQLIDWEEGK